MTASVAVSDAPSAAISSAREPAGASDDRLRDLQELSRITSALPVVEGNRSEIAVAPARASRRWLR